MPAAVKLTVDALWMCLCPNFTPVLRRSSYLLSAKHNPQVSICGRSPKLSPPRRRTYSSLVPGTRGGVGIENQHVAKTAILEKEGGAGHLGQNSTPPPRITRTLLDSDSPIDSSTPREPSAFGPRPNESFSKEQLAVKLQKAATLPDLKQTQSILKYLIQERVIRPTTEHYTALLLANCEAKHGSATAVEELLNEMELEGVAVDAGVLHAALKALAVHPDHLLRTSILDTMKSRWIDLSLEGWHDIVVGLVRERLLEMAILKLEEMRKQELAVQPWLYSMVIYACCDVEDFATAQRIINKVPGSGPSLSTWHYVLDAASQAFDYETTSFVWRKKVGPMYLNPPTGICQNVLVTAARAGDAVLASDVLRVLSNRKASLSLNEYESLVDAYVLVGEIEGAFRILYAMKATGVEPTSGSTRSLQAYMLEAGPEYPTQAWEMLKRFHKDNSDGDSATPIALVNVVLEAQILHGDKTLPNKWYQELCSLGIAHPNTATINQLLQFPSLRGEHGKAHFLFKELTAWSLKADQTTWERFILTFIAAKVYAKAYGFFLEARNELREWTFSKKFKALVAERCEGVENEFAKLLRDDITMESGRHPSSLGKIDGEACGDLKKDGVPVTNERRAVFIETRHGRRARSGRRRKQILAWRNKMKGEVSQQDESMSEVDEAMGMWLRSWKGQTKDENPS